MATWRIRWTHVAALAVGAVIWSPIVLFFFFTLTAQAGEIRVIDGDSICMENVTPCPDRLNLRLENIDAPEINGKCERERDLARQAKQLVDYLLRGESRLIPSGSTDRHRRPLGLAQTWTGFDVGDLLVEQGLARPWLTEEEYRRNPPKGWC